MRIILSALLLGTFGCRSIRPYEKEFLLNPVMDDAKLQHVSSDYLSIMYGKYERLSSQGAGSASTSCPTCGG